MFQIASSVFHFEEDVSGVAIFIGRGSRSSFHIVDDQLAQVLEADQIDVGIFQTYTSCYLPSNGDLLKSESHVLMRNGSVLKIAQLMAIKSGQNLKKYVRGVEYKEENNDVYKETDCEVIHTTDNILRKVILYPSSRNTYICIDFNRPSFLFNFVVCV